MSILFPAFHLRVDSYIFCTPPPHLTLGYGTAQYTKKGALGLWPRGLREDNASDQRQKKKREAEEADKVEVAPG